MDDKVFHSRIRRTNGVYDKGVEVKDSAIAAKQAMHAYFGAYGYDHDANTDYVACYIMDMAGNVLYREVDDRRVEPEPTPEPEE